MTPRFLAHTPPCHELRNEPKDQNLQDNVEVRRRPELRFGTASPTIGQLQGRRSFKDSGVK